MERRINVYEEMDGTLTFMLPTKTIRYRKDGQAEIVMMSEGNETTTQTSLESCSAKDFLNMILNEFKVWEH